MDWFLVDTGHWSQIGRKCCPVPSPCFKHAEEIELARHDAYARRVLPHDVPAGE